MLSANNTFCKNLRGSSVTPEVKLYSEGFSHSGFLYIPFKAEANTVPFPRYYAILVKNIHFMKMPPFSVQIFSRVRIFCDYLLKSLFLYMFLMKFRTLLAFFTENRLFFQQSHNSGRHLLK